MIKAVDKEFVLDIIKTRVNKTNKININKIIIKTGVETIGFTTAALFCKEERNEINYSGRMRNYGKQNN